MIKHIWDSSDIHKVDFPPQAHIFQCNQAFRLSRP
jgi:hypothetical protein